MEKHRPHKLHKRVQRNILSKRRTWVIALIVLLVAVGGALAGKAAHAAGNTIQLNPTGGAYTVGNTLSVQVRENSGGTNVYATQVGLTYPQNLLQYVSTDGNGSNFPTDTGLGSGGNGHVKIVRGSTQPVANDALIATVNFTVTAAGSATIGFDALCQGTSTANCSGVYDATLLNVASSVTGGTYTLNASTCPAGQVGTPPNCTTPVTTCPTGQIGTPPNCTTPTTGGGGSTSTGSGSTSTGSTTTKSSSSAITPKNSTAPIVAPDGSQVQVSTPADIQPATVQPDGVQKIQYYLNNKLVYTASAVPYTYHLDTTRLLNGTYTLKTIKYYISGQQETTTQRLVIKNPFSLIQFGLLLRHYLIEILIPFVLIIAAIVLVYFRINHIKWYKGPGSSTPDSPKSMSPTAGVQGPTVVTPST